jgi:hypothetical protein
MIWDDTTIMPEAGTGNGSLLRRTRKVIEVDRIARYEHYQLWIFPQITIDTLQHIGVKYIQLHPQTQSDLH